MIGSRPARDLFAAGALSAGLVVVGEVFGLPLLSTFGSLIVLTVLGAAALEGLLASGRGTDAGPDRDGESAAGARRNRRVRGPLVALLAAGGIAGVGAAAEVRPLVIFGSLFALAVTGGLATLGVLGPTEDSDSTGSRR